MNSGIKFPLGPGAGEQITSLSRTRGGFSWRVAGNGLKTTRSKDRRPGPSGPPAAAWPTSPFPQTSQRARTRLP